MGIIPQGRVHTLPQTPLPRFPLPFQTKGSQSPLKTPHRPLQASLAKGYLLRATGILTKAGRTRTCSSCTSAWRRGEELMCGSLEPSPAGRPGRLGFVYHRSHLSLRHRAVEARVCCFSISRQVSMARPWLALSPRPPAQVRTC